MNKFLQLLADNRGVRSDARRYEIVNAADGEATIYLYDMIVSSKSEAEWWGGVAAENFVRDINAITAPVIHLRINSPGGDVFAARAMEAAVRAHPSKVVAHVDGYAASAASFLAIACDEVEITEGGFFMIHKAWTYGGGNSDDLKATADLLEKIDQSLVASYAKKTKCSAQEIIDMMAAETWIGAIDAVNKGFADRISDGEVGAKIEWNVEVLKAGRRDPAPRNELLEQESETKCACPSCGSELVLTHKIELGLITMAENDAEDVAEEADPADPQDGTDSRVRAMRLMRHIETIVP